MSSNLTAINTRGLVSKSLLVDILGLTFIYFVPSISHLLSVPLYLVEPMRVMLIIAIAHTTKRNAYIIALTLPLFSFLTTAHPFFFKTIIISIELVINVWLFYFLATKWKNYFGAMITSILISKVFYYIMKFGLISAALLDSSLISTPIYLQVITMTAFSAYLFLVFRHKEIEPPEYTDPTK